MSIMNFILEIIDVNHQIYFGDHQCQSSKLFLTTINLKRSPGGSMDDSRFLVLTKHNEISLLLTLKNNSLTKNGEIRIELSRNINFSRLMFEIDINLDLKWSPGGSMDDSRFLILTKHNEISLSLILKNNSLTKNGEIRSELSRNINFSRLMFEIEINQD